MGAIHDSDGCCDGDFVTDPQDCPDSDHLLPGQQCCPGLSELAGLRIRCWDPPTPAPTPHCTSSDCMKKCRRTSDCGEDESCTVVLHASESWGAGYSVCMGRDISSGNFCMVDNDCASKKCIVKKMYRSVSGLCRGEPTTGEHPAWIGFVLAGAGVVVLMLITGCAAMWLRHRHSDAREVSSPNHSLKQAFPDVCDE